MKNKGIYRISLSFFFSIFSFNFIILSVAEAGLKEYIEKKDRNYTWKLDQKHEIDTTITGYSLKMVSQKWQGITWKHAVRVIIPANVKDSTNAILIIGGNRHDDPERIKKDLKKGKKIAVSVAAPVALLYDIPNQPLFGDLSEDRLLAETFDRYKKTKDDSWPIIFPMVKSTLRAMDALQEFMQKDQNIRLNKFLITGASKRGWTTWLTPVVDDRVMGISPMVYDNLNLVDQMEYQLESWGKYSESIKSYTEKGLPQKLIKREGAVSKLADMIDPYTYIKEITVPKLLVNGTNDSFWVLDAVKHYLPKLSGETFLHYAPNAGHGLEEGRDEIISSVVTFFKYLDGRIQFPKIKYEVEQMEASRKMHFTSDIEPWEVTLQWAKSPTRDFRKAKWKSLPLLEKRGRYARSIAEVKEHYVAFYCQSVFYLDGEELILSSQISIMDPKVEKDKEKGKEILRTKAEKEPESILP